LKGNVAGSARCPLRGNKPALTVSADQVGSFLLASFNFAVPTFMISNTVPFNPVIAKLNFTHASDFSKWRTSVYYGA
jgi:hypothetical protein